MASPLRSQLHVDQLLSNVAVKYENKRFIADQVFPMVPVKKTSDLYRTYNRNWNIPHTDRAPGGLAREHQFEVGTSSYSLERHALKVFIDDTMADNYDITSLEVDATNELVEKIMMRKEAQCAALFTTTSWSLGASLGGDDSWATTLGTPINLFDTGVSQVVSNAGVKPNFAIMPIDTFNAVKNHTTIVDRVKYTSRELNANIIGGLLGVSDILVPDIYYDSGIYGASAATGAIASIWKTDFTFLGYKAPAAGMMALSAGYCFQKAKPMVRKWREEERYSTAVEVDLEFSFKVVASLCGYYINDTI